MLLTLGLTLTIASAYLSQVVSHPIVDSSEYDTPEWPPAPDVKAALRATLPTFTALVILHASLAVMWTEALPRIGVHTASYAALLAALAIFFVGLASWGALS
jgi:hypothetical protein